MHSPMRRRTIRALLGVAVTALVVPAVAAATPQSPYYKFDIVQTGTSFGQGPSINNNGAVAFVSHGCGSFSDGLWFWDPPTIQIPTNFNPTFTCSDRRFNESVQLNDSNKVVAQDTLPGSPPSTRIRIWDTAANDSFTTIARGGNSGDYDSVFSNPSMNNNGQVAFSALNGSQTILATPSTFGFNELQVQTPIRQAMSDDGKVVFRAGSTPDSPIKLDSNDFTDSTTIANTAGGVFTSTGRSPGITDDGVAVAFYGDLSQAGADGLRLLGNGPTNAGPGIFLSVDEGMGLRRVIRLTGRKIEINSAAGGNDDGICDAGETCRAYPELGWNRPIGPPPISPAPISFSSYEADTRVAVTHSGDMPLGDRAPANITGLTSLDGDSFVVAFMATPTEASSMTVDGGSLFSNQLGIWTVRVDVSRDIAGPLNREYEVRSPIPVAQVGDAINGHPVTGLAMNDALGQGTKDSAGSPRTLRRGDHQIAFWASTPTGNMIVRGTHFDSDEDGLLDHWESGGTGNGIDFGNGHVLNLNAMGANPLQRDIFMEIDWLAPRNDGINVKQSYAPAPKVTAALASMFASAPATTDGIPAGITMHIDAGPGNDATNQPYSQNMNSGPKQGGDQISSATGKPLDVVYNGVPGSLNVPGVSMTDFQGIKDQYFGVAAADGGARELAFHYTLLADYYSFIEDASGNPWTDNVLLESETTDSNGNPVSQLAAATQLPTDLPGHSVEITSGPGAGQIRNIVAEDPTVDTHGNPTPIWIDVSPRFKAGAAPDNTSTFTLLNGSGGVAEADWRPDPDRNGLPGNDQMITLGGYGVDTGGWLANQCVQPRILAHELGHTLGLRHGGTDFFQYKGGPLDADLGIAIPQPGNTSPRVQYTGPPYLSLMSYSYQNDCRPFPAHLTTRLATANSNLRWIASNPGTAGNAISVAYVDPGAPNKPLTVTVAGNAITINLATNAGGAPVSTAFAIRNAALGSAAASAVAFPRLAPGSDGTGVVSAMPATSLVGGRDKSPVVAYSVRGDPTFDDWDNLDLDFQDTLSAVGNSYWLGAGLGDVSQIQPDDYTVETYREQNDGHSPDLAPPSTTVGGPRDGKGYAVGDSVVVTFTATDDSGVTGATVSLDLDGNGDTSGTGESLAASIGSQPNTYTATLGPLAGPAGTRTLTIVVSDGVHDVTTSRSITVGATSDNDPPTVSLSALQPVGEGSSFTVTAGASDPENDALTYAWTVNGVSVPGSAATATLTAGDGPGTTTIGVSVSDGHGHAATDTASVSVTNVAPSGTFGNDGPVGEGSPFHLSLSAATDPSSADTAAGFSYAFDCGGGSGYSAFGSSASAACGTSDNGSRSVGAKIRDRDGGVREYRDTATVTNVAPHVSPAAVRPQYWGLPSAFGGSATDPSPADQAAGFTAAWAFGDGGSASGFSTTHAYAKPGTYTASLSATDKDGGTGTAATAVTVNKRAGALAYAGPLSAPFGFLTLQARFTETVDPATALLGGRPVVFLVGTTAATATTDASGVATVTPAPIVPGSYPVAMTLGNDAYYTATAGRATITITRSLGTVTGTGLRFPSGGTASLTLTSTATGVTGSLSYTGPGLSVTATNLGPLGIRSDGRAAWLAGVDTLGRKLTVYLEDNGVGAQDVFRLTVNGALATGTGALSDGDVVISGG